MMPLISVVIPTYNNEETIYETVNSVLSQTFVDLEVVVVNDGSEDETLTKLRAINDSRLRIFSQKNSGVSSSRNYGIAATSGDFVAFLDADDVWVPDKLASQLKALQANPQAAVAYSWVDYIDSTGAFLRPGRHSKFQGNVYTQLLKSNFLECGSNPLIRRLALQQVGGFDVELDYGEDWEMWVRLAKRYEFVLVESPQVLYRISTSSASFNFQKHETLKIKSIETVFADVTPSLIPLKRICLANFYRYLTFKVLDTPVATLTHRQRGLLAIRYWWISVNHNPTLARQPKVVVSTLLRILNLILSSHPAKLA